MPRACTPARYASAPGCHNRAVPGNDPDLHWLPDPLVLAPIAVLVAIYVRRFRARAARGGRPRGGARPGGLFAAGIAALLVALASPLDRLGEDYLFSAHMLQHVLLGDIAPALLLLSLSRVILRPVTRRLMGVERALGPFASPVDRDRHLARADVPLARPRPVRGRDRAPGRPPPRARLVLHRRRGRLVAADRARADAPPASRGSRTIAYIGTAKFGLAALGLYLTWSGTVVYDYYEGLPRIWGISPVEDQNAGGAIMMVEQSLTFVIALVVLFMRMLTQSETRRAAARAAGGRGLDRLALQRRRPRSVPDRSP